MTSGDGAFPDESWENQTPGRSASDSALRILVATHYAPPHRGGIEFVAWELARAFTRRGHSVRWVTSAIPSAEPDPADPCPVVRQPAWNPLEKFGIPYPILHPSSSRQFRSLVRESDVVHVHGMLYAGTSAAIREARRARKPVVLTCHTIDRAGGAALASIPGGVSLVRAAETLGHALVGKPNLREASAVVVLKDEVKRFVEAAVPAVLPVLIIPNGVDVDSFRPVSLDEKRFLRRTLGLPDSGLVIAAIGRVVPKKNIHLVSLAAPSGSTVVVAGDGDGVVLEAAEGTRLVRWPSQPREAIRKLLGAADLLALPATGEGFPLVAQEAMATGLPMLLANDPGYSAYVDERCALLVEPTIEAVRNGLTRLASDAAFRESLGRAARERVLAAGTWDVTAERYEALFRALIDRAQLDSP